MRICVLGAGSLGCVFGAHLTEGGHDVVLVNRSAVLVEHLNRHGLTLHTKSGDRTVRVKAAVDCRALGPVDLLILLVKSFHTKEALEAARNVIGPKTAVLSLQNGLGHEEIIAAVAGKDKVLIGKTYVGGTMTSPGHVIAGTDGRPTTIGEPDGSLSERVQSIADAVQQSGARDDGER
jgi:2-dehydropantoate 2-reductase